MKGITLRLLLFCAFLGFGIQNTTALSVASDGGKMAEPAGESNNFKFGGTNPSEPGQEGYRASYYFAGQNQQPHFPNGDWNREASYTPPVSTDLGYSGDASHGYQSSYHPVPSTSYGADEGFDHDGGAGGILGGLGGLGGLLGIKGLKGLGIFGLLKLGILPLLFLIIPAIIIIPLLLLFIPIPVITIPQGRSFGMDIKDITGKVSSLARSVLDSDKCIERISCEVSRYGRGTFLDQTLKRMIYKYEPQMPNPLQRMARAYLDVNVPGCKKYNCFLLDDISTPSSSPSKKYKKTS